MKVIPFFIGVVQGSNEDNMDSWMHFYFNHKTNGRWDMEVQVGIEGATNEQEEQAIFKEMQEAFEWHKERITKRALGVVPTLEAFDDPNASDVDEEEWDFIDCWDIRFDSGNEYTVLLYLAYELVDKEEED